MGTGGGDYLSKTLLIFLLSVFFVHHVKTTHRRAGCHSRYLYRVILCPKVPSPKGEIPKLWRQQQSTDKLTVQVSLRVSMRKVAINRPEKGFYSILFLGIL